MKKLLPVAVLIFLVLALDTRAQIITTIAGGDSLGLGDGGPAISCELKFPYGAAVDASGNFYIADAGHNRIRKVNSAGIITTIAGTGVAGYSGDDSAATSAKLNSPTGVAIDAAGNIFIADDYNARIRKISPGGIITTIAGTGSYGYSGDNGPGTAAELYAPHGIAVDAGGNIFFSDELNNRVRMINSSGIISTVAGTGTAGNTGDGGPATGAQLDHPYGVAVDASGNIFVCTAYDNRVHKISSSGIIITIAGDGTMGFGGDGGPATSAKLNSPIGVAVDREGNIYVGDGYNHRVRKVYPSGIISTYAGNGVMGFSGDGGPATLAQLYDPVGVAVDTMGNLYIAEYENFRVRFIRNTVAVQTMYSKTELLEIRPNPSRGQFSVKVNSNVDESANIIVFDAFGKLVKELVCSTNQTIIVSLDVPSGIYSLVTKTSSLVERNKIIIER